MQFTFEELRDLLLALGQTDITELTLKSDDFELTVRRGAPAAEAGIISGAVDAGLSVVRATAPLPTPVPEAGAEPARPAAAPPSPSPLEKKGIEIVSPMVGTFYRAPAPDEPPFVDVGDRIRVGQTVCIIEAMKLMNELEAEVSGEVIEVLVKNGEPVEYGQPLMRINPD